MRKKLLEPTTWYKEKETIDKMEDKKKEMDGKMTNTMNHKNRKRREQGGDEKDKKKLTPSLSCSAHIHQGENWRGN